MIKTDIEIIEFFISCTHSETKMRAMSRYVSDDFYFDSQLRGKLDFDAYCAHEGAISYNCSTETLEIIQADIGYNAYVIHHILDNVENFYADLPVTMRFEIKDGLICCVQSGYKTNEQLQNYLKNIFKPIFK